MQTVCLFYVQLLSDDILMSQYKLQNIHILKCSKHYFFDRFCYCVTALCFTVLHIVMLSSSAFFVLCRYFFCVLHPLSVCCESFVSYLVLSWLILSMISIAQFILYIINSVHLYCCEHLSSPQAMLKVHNFPLSTKAHHLVTMNTLNLNTTAGKHL